MRQDGCPARCFEDTIDGYFPLRESLRQLLDRLETRAAWLVLQQAPVLDMPGLPPDAPVPLYITEARAGLLHRASLVARRSGARVRVHGVARWTWWDRPEAREDLFDPDHRLAEPAFVRGLALDDRARDRDVPGREYTLLDATGGDAIRRGEHRLTPERVELRPDVGAGTSRRHPLLLAQCPDPAPFLAVLLHES